MNENIKRYYFTVIKLCCLILLIIFYVINSGKPIRDISHELFFLSVILAAAVGYEQIDSADSGVNNVSNILGLIGKISGKDINGRKFTFLLAEIILTIIYILSFRESSNGLFLLAMVILDAVTFFKLSFTFSLLCFAGLMINREDLITYSIYCVFMIIIYFQHYCVAERYKKYLEDFEQEEYRLKDSIHIKDTEYKEELEKSSLAFENKMLEEKARLSQALHDKLGHSINGSIYQLEACKVLMDKKPEDSKKIVQGVIDNLRTSMDEIRSILRREKPDKKRMAMIQLSGLCGECMEKYGIRAEVRVNGEDKGVPEYLWEVILDNSIEAVTNALKYSKCRQIIIEIAILHKVLRCTITDDGIGCSLPKEGMGLQGMKNRVRKVNGFIDINGDNGFCINMIFPLNEK